MNIDQYSVREHHATQNDEYLMRVVGVLGYPVGTEPIIWSEGLESQLRTFLTKKKEEVTKGLNINGRENPPLAHQYFGLDLDPNNFYVEKELSLVKDLLTLPSNTKVIFSNGPDKRCSLCRLKSPNTQVAPHCLLEQIGRDELGFMERYDIPIFVKLGINYTILEKTETQFKIEMSMGDYRKFIMYYDALLEL